MSYINPRTGKAYPMPTQAARERARAHKTMAFTLRDLEAKVADSPAAYLSVIRQERERQERMLRHFRDHYGANAGTI